MTSANPYEAVIRLVRAARGLEAGGYNGAAKLMWALAYSEEIARSNDAGIPRGEELDQELTAIIHDLQTAGKTDLAEALEKGQRAIHQDAPIPFSDIGFVHASRTTGEVFLGTPPEFTSNHDHTLGLKLFLPVWYFEPLTPQQVLDALEHNPELIELQIKGLSAEQLLVPPAPGEWNMHELLAHLYSAQQLVAGRVECLLTEDNPDLAGAATWADTGNRPLSPAEILERYRDSRQKMVERLKGISPADWWRPGWHTEFGPQTVLSQATYFARHEMSHMPQFAEIRRAHDL
jgi:hypothetical protein